MAKSRHEKVIDFFIVVLTLLGVFLFFTIRQNIEADIPEGSARISFLNVGQGDSILISMPDNTQVLIDTGKPGSLLTSLSQRMPAFDREIEAVFLTHPDSDHSGGFEQLATSYKIDTVYLNTESSDSKTFEKVIAKIKERGIKSEVVSRKDEKNFGKLKIEVLWPKDDSMSDNDSSLVMRAIYGESKALLTGDIELEGQQSLLKLDPESIVSDLYKVPHHGSGGAWNENFIKKVSPKNAVIPVGRNSYGHPAKTVLDGLASLGINVFRTDREGTIDFIATENGWVKK